ncbi:hypothetical protein LINPERPRIM_LOCUS30609, partial [Linum perenne]
MQMLQAHRHVLVNCSIVEPFLHECKEEFKRRMRRRTRDVMDKEVHLKFVDWFRGRITNSARGTHSADLMMLAKGPRWEATRYTVYDINGFRFQTLERERSLKTQNNGICGTFDTENVASASDINPVRSNLYYYGKLEDIVELNYYGRFTTLFKCKWANTLSNSWKKIYALGLTMINFNHTMHEGDRESHE